MSGQEQSLEKQPDVRTPVIFPVAPLDTAASFQKKSAAQLLGAEEYARCFDFSPDRVKALLKEIGLPEEIESRIATEIEANCQTEAFKAVIEGCPAGRRMITAYYPAAGSSSKEAFEMLGTAFFYTSLLKDEGALAQELCRLFDERSNLEGISPAEFHKRVEHALLEKSTDYLSCIPVLLKAENEDKNKLGQTAFLRGLLAPYFEAGRAAQPRGFIWRGLLRLYEAFHIPPEQLADLNDRRLTRHDRRLLRTLGEAEYAPMVNPGLQWALDELKGVEAINATEEFLRSARSISVPELACILGKIPRGVNWGKKRGVPDTDSFIEVMENRGHKTAGFAGFLGLDVILAKKAISLCNGAGDSSEVSKFGEELRNIIQSSKTSCDDGSNFRAQLSDFLENELTATLVKIMKRK